MAGNYGGIVGMGSGLADEMSNIPFGKIIGGPLIATVEAQGNAARTTVRFLQENCIDDYSDAPTWDDVGENGNQDVLSLPSSLANQLPPTERRMHPKKLPAKILPKGCYVHGSSVSWDGRYYVAKQRVPGDISPTSEAGKEYWREVGVTNIRTVNFRYDQKVKTPNGVSKDSHSLTIPLMAMVPIPFLRIQQLDVDFNVKLASVEATSSVGRVRAQASVSKRFGFKRFGPSVSIGASFSAQRTKGESNKVSRSYDMGVKIRAGQAEMPVGVERMINLLDKLITEDIGEIED